MFRSLGGFGIVMEVPVLDIGADDDLHGDIIRQAFRCPAGFSVNGEDHGIFALHDLHFDDQFQKEPGPDRDMVLPHAAAIGSQMEGVKMLVLDFLSAGVPEDPEADPAPHDVPVFGIIGAEICQQDRIVPALELFHFHALVDERAASVRLHEGSAVPVNGVPVETDSSILHICREQNENGTSRAGTILRIGPDLEDQSAGSIRFRQGRDQDKISAAFIFHGNSTGKDLFAGFIQDPAAEPVGRSGKEGGIRREHHIPVQVFGELPVDIGSSAGILHQCLHELFGRAEEQSGSGGVVKIAIQHGRFSAPCDQLKRHGFCLLHGQGIDRKIVIRLCRRDLIQPASAAGNTHELCRTEDQTQLVFRRSCQSDILTGDEVEGSTGDQFRGVSGAPFQRGSAFAIQIDRDKQIVPRAIRPGEEDGIDTAAIQKLHHCSVAEGGMESEEQIEPADQTVLIFRGTPVQSGSLVDVDLLGGEPFHAVCETEGAGNGAERGKSGPHGGIGTGDSGKAVVVVGLRIMDHEAVAGAFTPRVAQIAFDLVPGIILEQFGIRPVQVRLIQQGSRHSGIAAQPFQQEDRLRKLLPDPGSDVFPGGRGDHVPGIAAEAIHPSAAPDKKDICQIFPEIQFAVVQFGQVAPGNAPGAGGMDGTVRLPDQPVRMGFVEFCSPAGVVDSDVDEKFCIPLVDFVRQFDKLIQRGRFSVELRQRGIDRRKIEGGIRTAEASHTPVNGGSGIDRQQVDDPAFQVVHNVVQLPDQIPESAGAGDEGVAVIVKFLQFLRRNALRQRGDGFVPVLPELADKGAVHAVGAAIGGGFHIDMHIMPFRPDRLRAVIRHEGTLTFKVTGFGESEPDGEGIIVDLLHGDIGPVSAAGGDPFFHFFNNLRPAEGGIAEVRAKECFTGHDLSGKLHLKFHRIAGIADQMFSGFWKLFDLHRLTALFKGGSICKDQLFDPALFLSQTYFKDQRLRFNRPQVQFHFHCQTALHPVQRLRQKDLGRHIQHQVISRSQRHGLTLRVLFLFTGRPDLFPILIRHFFARTLDWRKIDPDVVPFVLEPLINGNDFQIVPVQYLETQDRRSEFSVFHKKHIILQTALDGQRFFHFGEDLRRFRVHKHIIRFIIFLADFLFFLCGTGHHKNRYQQQKKYFLHSECSPFLCRYRQISIFFAFYKYNGLNLNIKGVLL